MEKRNQEYDILKAQLTAIFQSSSDGMYITDGEGKFLNVNTGLERITGVKKEELLGTYAKDLVGRGIINRSVVQMIVEEKRCVTINQNIKSNRLKEVMVTGTPVFDSEGKIIYIVANLRDMTYLVHLENECNKAQMLSKHYYSQLLKEKSTKGKFVAESEEMKKLIQLAQRVAQVDSTVLLEGESGTGKEIFSTFIHKMSPRSEGPFISINCAGVPENLLESELFGYEEGAFTGAKKGGKIGLIELSENGTLFLDEINSLPLALQGKLLKVIDSFEITRVGSSKSQKINFRLITATNKNLQELVDKGSFREDLYFRLCVVPIIVIPLRKRKDDIIPLVFYYMEYFNKKYNYHKGISADTFKYLQAYDWPGNVRELKNIIERLVVMSEDELITKKELPNELIANHISSDKFQINVKKIVPFNELMGEAETQLISLAMKQCKSTREAARILNISQTSVIRKYKKIKDLNL